MYKIGDKIIKKDGTVKTITLFDLIAAFGGADLGNATDVNIKKWNKFDRFVHGFLVCNTLLKKKAGKKLLKECNIEINNLTLEQILEDHKSVNNF